MVLGAHAARADEGQAAESYRAGVALAAEKKYPEAVAKLLTAVKLNPGLGEAYFWIGVCEFAQGHDASALSNLKQALVSARDPKQAGLIHYDLGVLYLKGGDKPRSDEEYRTAVALNPVFANRPIARRNSTPPVPAAPPVPPAAPPPPPDSGSPFGRAAVLFVGPLVALALALAARRLRGGARAPLASTAGPGTDDVRRAVSAWTLEPELQNAAVPRTVKLRSPIAYAMLLFPLLYVAMVALIAMPSSVKTALISWQGSAGTGTIVRKFQVRRSSKHGGYLENRLQFSYLSGAGASWTDVPTGDDSSVAVGQAVAIHYLPSLPGWAALDDDFGFGAGKWKLLIAMAATGLITSAFILILAMPTMLRERRLIRSGTIVAARITETKTGAQGAVTASFSYDWNGQVLRGTKLSTRNAGLQAGQVVTALVDPDHPNSATLYQASSWRVAASS